MGIHQNVLFGTQVIILTEGKNPPEGSRYGINNETYES